MYARHTPPQHETMLPSLLTFSDEDAPDTTPGLVIAPVPVSSEAHLGLGGVRIVPGESRMPARYRSTFRPVAMAS